MSPQCDEDGLCVAMASESEPAPLLRGMTIMKRFFLFVSVTAFIFLSVMGYAEVPVVDAHSVPMESYSLNANVAPEPPPQPSISQQSATLLLAKINDMQQELQTLQGRLEVQAHDIQLLRQQQRAFYQDLDQRLVKLQKSNGVAVVQPQAPAIVAPVAKTAIETPANDVSAYESAYGLVRDKKYDAATEAMQQFINQYPQSQYTANAHYWLGELYLRNSQLDLAEREFSVVMQQYPNSNKAGAAQLKLGFIHYDRGEWQQARKLLAQVEANYPGTAISRLAKIRLQEMTKRGV